MNDWAQKLENELDDQYDIASYWDKDRRCLEIDTPASRHKLEVSLTNVYGFVLSLVIGDETGGVLKDVDLASCIRSEHLADTIHSFYTTYEG
jgi:hypothetical protein